MPKSKSEKIRELLTENPNLKPAEIRQILPDVSRNLIKVVRHRMKHGNRPQRIKLTAEDIEFVKNLRQELKSQKVTVYNVKQILPTIKFAKQWVEEPKDARKRARRRRIFQVFLSRYLGLSRQDDDPADRI